MIPVHYKVVLQSAVLCLLHSVGSAVKCYRPSFPVRSLGSTVKMNKINKFDYVKTYETEEKCLPNCWIIVRLDGKGFHRFCDLHSFEKPNDKRALELMSRAAASVLEEFRDICIAYGQSDEYSFVFRKDTLLFNRRKDKLVTNVVSLFASSYVYYWSDFFPSSKLLYPPSFDGRIVLFPTDSNLRDYMSFRQADNHINNLYNTAFWALVLKKRLTPQQAEEALRGTLASDKNEILFKEFGINYNNEPLLFRKGTALVRKLVSIPSDNDKLKHVVIPLCCDLIRDDFWKEHSEILEMESIQVYNNSQNFPTFPGVRPNIKRPLKDKVKPEGMNKDLDGVISSQNTDAPIVEAPLQK